MTWEPKNKLDDEDVDVSDDDDKDRDDDKDDDQRLSHFQHPGLDTGHPGLGSSHHHQQDSGKSGIPIPPSKPKIWSLADTAVAKTPPPVSSLLGGGGPPGGSHAHPSHPSPGGQTMPAPGSHLPPVTSAAAAIPPPFSMPQGMAGAYPGMGHAPWGNAFSQFADPRAAALRTNMFGAIAGPMGLGALGGMMASSAASAASSLPAPPPPPPGSAAGVGLPTVSPSVSALSGNSENLQTDTPPHTPPTGGSKPTGAAQPFYNGAAGLQNGFGSSPGGSSTSTSSRNNNAQ